MAVEKTETPTAEGAPAAEASAGPEAQEPQVSEGAALAMNAMDGLPGVDTSGMLDELGTDEPEVPATEEPAEKPEAEAGQPAEEPPASEEPNEEPATEEPATEEKPEGSNEEDEGSDEPLVIKSPIYGDKGKKVGGDEQDGKEGPKFEVTDEMKDYMKDTYGVEDFSQLSQQVDKWKGQEEELTATTKELKNAQDIFQEMPPLLYQAVKTYYEGDGNWRDVITSKPNLDFSKEGKDHGKEDLIKAYFPEAFTEEDWEEYSDKDGDAGIKKAIDARHELAVTKYDGQRTEFNNRQQQMIDDQSQKNQKLETSLAVTLEALPQQVEGIDEGYVKDIGKLFRGTGLQDIFFKEDGTLKEDAALRAVMAQDGKQLLDQYTSVTVNKAVSEERQDILDRGANKPKQQRGSSASNPDEVRPEVQKYISDLTGGLGQGTSF